MPPSTKQMLPSVVPSFLVPIRRARGRKAKPKKPRRIAQSKRQQQVDQRLLRTRSPKLLRLRLRRERTRRRLPPQTRLRSKPKLMVSLCSFLVINPQFCHVMGDIVALKLVAPFQTSLVKRPVQLVFLCNLRLSLCLIAG